MTPSSDSSVTRCSLCDQPEDFKAHRQQLTRDMVRLPDGGWTPRHKFKPSVPAPAPSTDLASDIATALRALNGQDGYTVNDLGGGRAIVNPPVPSSIEGDARVTEARSAPDLCTHPACGHPRENHLPRGRDYFRGWCSMCDCRAYDGPNNHDQPVPAPPALPVEGDDTLSDEDREWMDAPMGPPRHQTIATQLGAIYDTALVLARAYAFKHGYAIAVHGSEMRDLDLIAVPWTDEASDAETLVEAIREAVGGRHGQHPDAQRPHGRRSWSIHLNNEHTLGNFKPVLPYLDLSVMPRVVAVEPVEGDDSDRVEVARREVKRAMGFTRLDYTTPAEDAAWDALGVAERRVAEERIAELEGLLAETSAVVRTAIATIRDLRALSKPAQEAQG